MKLVYILYVISALLPVIVQSMEFTPESKLADCFRQNAIRALGSRCFARRGGTSGKRLQKHEFIKFILEKCGADWPFTDSMRYEEILKEFQSQTKIGQLVPVNGHAKIGDIVVDKKFIMVVETLGKYVFPVKQGSKLSKRTDWSFWKAAKRQAQKTHWRSVIPFTNQSLLIGPSDFAKLQCPASWRSRPSSNRIGNLYMGVIRSRRNQVWRVAYAINRDTLVYRYLPKLMQSSTSPPPVGTSTEMATDINECSNSPCQNGGTCVDQINQYSCNCMPGYSGENCHININECASAPCLNGGTCKDQVNGFRCTCAAGFMGPTCLAEQGSVAAFHIEKIIEQIRSRRFFGIDMDLSTFTFNTPRAGLYFGYLMSMPVGKADTFLQQSGQTLLGIKNHSLARDITDLPGYGRNVMFEAQAGSPVHVDLDIDNFGMIWSMCDLSSAMDPLVAFSVAATESQTDIGTVVFQEELYNSGSYSAATRTFSAPQAGLYFFSMSVGFLQNEPAALVLKRNGAVAQVLERGSAYPNMAGVLSTVILLQLDAADIISLDLINGTSYSDAEFKQTSWLGFLYSPRHGDPQAFSVSATQDYYPGCFQFETVNIETGIIFNQWYSVEATVPGVYYLHVTIGAADGDIQARVLLDRLVVLNLWMYLNYGRDWVSAGLFVNMEVGYQVWISCESRSHGYSGSQLPLTSFTGLLIYKDFGENINDD